MTDHTCSRTGTPDPLAERVCRDPAAFAVSARRASCIAAVLFLALMLIAVTGPLSMPGLLFIFFLPCMLSARCISILLADPAWSRPLAALEEACGLACREENAAPGFLHRTLLGFCLLRRSPRALCRSVCRLRKQAAPVLGDLGPLDVIIDLLLRLGCAGKRDAICPCETRPGKRRSRTGRW